MTLDPLIPCLATIRYAFLRKLQVPGQVVDTILAPTDKKQSHIFEILASVRQNLQRLWCCRRKNFMRLFHHCTQRCRLDFEPNNFLNVQRWALESGKMPVRGDTAKQNKTRILRPRERRHGRVSRLFETASSPFRAVFIARELSLPIHACTFTLSWAVFIAGKVQMTLVELQPHIGQMVKTIKS
jgi:hypothetical protein